MRRRVPVLLALVVLATSACGGNESGGGSISADGSSTVGPYVTSAAESFREEILYNAQQNTPALSSYFELMDRLVPTFLNTLSTQKIRGSRILLK